jgi:hypothetical protein
MKTYVMYKARIKKIFVFMMILSLLASIISVNASAYSFESKCYVSGNSYVRYSMFKNSVCVDLKDDLSRNLAVTYSKSIAKALINEYKTRYKTNALRSVNDLAYEIKLHARVAINAITELKNPNSIYYNILGGQQYMQSLYDCASEAECGMGKNPIDSNQKWLISAINFFDGDK